MSNFVCYIKSHCKLFALSTIRRFARNALFSGSIKDMNSKPSRRFKHKKINATWQFFKFLNKNNKPKNESATKKQNQD